MYYFYKTIGTKQKTIKKKLEIVKNENKKKTTIWSTQGRLKLKSHSTQTVLNYMTLATRKVLCHLVQQKKTSKILMQWL